MRDFAKIDAWRLADDLTVAIYQKTAAFPREELYGLTSQLRRAAYSAAANIAEGSARESKKDYLHFLYIARGSVAETRYFVHLAERLRYLSPEESARLEQHARETFACLQGLVRAVEKESGKLGTISAAATSFIVLAALRFGGTRVSGL
jgi:four helix bundle protein